MARGASHLTDGGGHITSMDTLESLVPMAELVRAENNHRRERCSQTGGPAVPPEGRFRPPYPAQQAGPSEGHPAGFPPVCPGHRPSRGLPGTAAQPGGPGRLKVGLGWQCSLGSH